MSGQRRRDFECAVLGLDFARRLVETRRRALRDLRARHAIETSKVERAVDQLRRKHQESDRELLVLISIARLPLAGFKDQIDEAVDAIATAERAVKTAEQAFDHARARLDGRR